MFLCAGEATVESALGGVRPQIAVLAKSSVDSAKFVLALQRKVM